MIRVAELLQYKDELTAALAAVNSSHLVLDETGVVKYLGDKKPTDNQIMLVIMPDARTKARNEDAVVMNNALGFFFLEKTHLAVSQGDEFTAIFARTQETAIAFVKKLIYDKNYGSCEFHRHLDVNNISIEPITGLASCNGWSVEVYFDTPF